MLYNYCSRVMKHALKHKNSSIYIYNYKERVNNEEKRGKV